ncbi:MAG: cell division protein DivIVA, partial [Raoultibacter sp.]
VDVFLERMANEFDAQNNQIAQINERIEEMSYAAPNMIASFEESSAPLAMVDTSDKDALIADLQQQLEARRGEDNAIAKALITAQRSGEEVVAQA